MEEDLMLDAFCAKKRGLSYGQYMALTDEKERKKLRKEHKKEFDAARKRRPRQEGRKQQ